MKQISAGTTAFHKWMPIFSFSLMAIGLLVRAASGFNGADVGFHAMAAIVLVVGGFIYYRYDWPMADQVLDMGDGVFVVRRSAQERFRFSDIKRFEAWSFGRARHVTIHFAKASAFGEAIRFRPAFTLREPDIKELNQRVSGARMSA